MITVNAIGDTCPIPVVKTKKVLDSVQGDAEISHSRIRWRHLWTMKLQWKI